MSRWEWVSADRAGLARFVTPERAARVLGPVPTDRSVFDILRTGGHADLVATLYRAVAARRPRYSLEPVHADGRSQRVRRPEDVLGTPGTPGEGTCLDLALVFAGLCVAHYLRPMVVVCRDHALVMVSCVDDYAADYPTGEGVFVDGVCDDGAALRGLLTQGSHLAVECTGFAVTTTTGDPRRGTDGLLGFADACTAGAAAIDEREVRFAILPFALHRLGIEPFEMDPPEGVLRVAAGPVLRAVDAPMTTAADASALLAQLGTGRTPGRVFHATPLRRLEPAVLVNRSAELARIGELLREPGRPLVYVLGVAGIGKSQVARAVLELRGDVAAVWLPAEGLEVTKAVATLDAALGLHLGLDPAVGVDDAVLALVAALREPVLVCIDGLEVLLDDRGEAAHGLGRLLDALATYEHAARVLITTRRLPRGVTAASPGTAVVRLGGLGRAEAAAMVAATSGLDPAALAGVGDDVYRLLGGHPKFIELFAAALRDLPLEAVRADLIGAAGLDDYVAMHVIARLSEAERAVLVAARPFRDTFEWDALDAVHEHVFGRPTTPESARALCSRAVLDPAGGPGVFYLHPVVRACVPAGPAQIARAHAGAATWFLRSGVDPRRLETWDEGLHHLRAAALADPEHEADAFFAFLRQYSLPLELAGWGRRLVEEWAVLDELAHPNALVPALNLGGTLFRLRDCERAVGPLERALDALRAMQDPQRDVVSLFVLRMLGRSYAELGRLDEIEALAEATTPPDEGAEPLAALQYAWFRFTITAEQLDRGLATAEAKVARAAEVLRLAQRWAAGADGRLGALAEAHFAMGDSLVSAGRIDDAVPHFDEQLRGQLATGNVPGVADALFNLGVLTGDEAMLLVSDQITSEVGVTVEQFRRKLVDARVPPLLADPTGISEGRARIGTIHPDLVGFFDRGLARWQRTDADGSAGV